ncbi:ATP-binding protein [Streptomonospora algeriensis]|uniref:ATP-binding protein n=1 Tax=Streptomonospora algeriensis TaxID=995084 RepID=A0ABW3BF79_9ACTN
MYVLILEVDMGESLTIPAAVAMVPVARRGAAALLAGFARVADAELIAAELVASAVRASTGEITVSVVDGDTVRIEVTDQRGRHPRDAGCLDADEDAPDGLGLVSAVADRMGSAHRRSGDCITWAELRPDSQSRVPAGSSQPGLTP